MIVWLRLPTNQLRDCNRYDQLESITKTKMLAADIPKNELSQLHVGMLYVLGQPSPFLASKHHNRNCRLRTITTIATVIILTDDHAFRHLLDIMIHSYPPVVANIQTSTVANTEGASTSNDVSWTLNQQLYRLGPGTWLGLLPSYGKPWGMT